MPFIDTQPRPPGFGLQAPVLILASNKPGRIEAIHDRVGQERQFSVRYVNDTGAVCEDWFRGDEIAVPKAKVARKPRPDAPTR